MKAIGALFLALWLSAALAVADEPGNLLAWLLLAAVSGLALAIPLLRINHPEDNPQ